MKVWFATEDTDTAAADCKDKEVSVVTAGVLAVQKRALSCFYYSEPPYRVSISDHLIDP